MTAGIWNFTDMEQGADWAWTLYFRDSAGAPVDLSAYAARMKLRRTYPGDAVLSLENGSGITLGADGSIALAVTAAQTAAIPASPESTEYLYDLEIVSGSGEVTRLMQGTILVSPEVTYG